MDLGNGVIAQQDYHLNSLLTSENPYIPNRCIVYGYDLVGSDRVNNIAKIGPGLWNYLPAMFQGAPGGKVTLNLTGGSMSADGILVLPVLQEWIDQIGDNLGIVQILVNKRVWPITAEFTAYPVVAGSSIIITGLETIANTLTLDIILI